MSAPFVVDSKGVYHCLEFDEFVWQKHGFGSRHGNPSAAITLRQVHSDIVLQADLLSDRAAEGDALVTAKPGVSIGVRTADCVPLLLLDSRSQAVAAVHAGWRGTAAAIAVRTIESLQASYGSDSEQLYAAIGPCILACCYQVSEGVALRFADYPDAQRADGPGKYKLDLAAINRFQLQAAGVPPAHIFDSQLCTSCLADQFFSYRREPSNPGRMLSAICRFA